MKTNRSNKLFEQTRIATLGLQDLLAFGQLQPDGTYKVRNVTNSNFLNAVVISEQITYADLLALATANELVAGKNYTITDAVSGTMSLYVFAVSISNLAEYGYDTTTGQAYSYDLATDTASNADNTGFINFTPQTAPAYQRGRMWYDSTTETVSYYDEITGTSVQVGQEELVRARNSTGSTILNGAVVYISGAQGQNPRISLAQANAESTSRIIGVATHNISNNTVGKVCTFGIVGDLNTSAYNEGDVLYLSTSVAGGLTTTRPSAPNQAVMVGTVIHSAVNDGKILVHTENYGIGYGTANQVRGMNAAGTAEEYKTLTGTSNQVTVTHTSGVVTFSLPQNIATNSDVVFNQVSAQQFVKPGGTSSQFLKANGTVDSTPYIAGFTLAGEVSGSGSTFVSVTLDNAAVTGKVLTGLSVSGSAIVSTDSILVALGKVQNQINALAGGVSYQGTWNASANTPSLTSSVGTKGYYYVVSVAGSTNLNGITDWKLGDWVIFNGSTWDKVDNTDAVISVNGYTGIVTLAKGDIGLGNVENTALSTWAGSSSITTLGTIGTGTWQGTAIGDTYISSASTWNAKIGGSGTTGKLAKFTASGTVGDSIVSESGGAISIGGAVRINGNTTIYDASVGVIDIVTTDAALRFINIAGINYMQSGTGLSSSSAPLKFTSMFGVSTWLSLFTNKLITFDATDTGEAHIFGGSARVNGALESTSTITSTQTFISANNNNTSDYNYLVFNNTSAGYGDWNIYKIDSNNLAIGYGTSAGSSYTNALTFAYGGNVGIGTTSPQTKLSVTTTGDNWGLFIGPNAGDATGQRLKLGYFGTSNYSAIQSIEDGVNVRPLALNPDGGNVGIGTTTPVYKVQIVESGNALLQLNGNNTTGALDTGFTISADDSKNIYLYQRENGFLDIGVNNASKMRIKTNTINIVSLPTSSAGLSAGDLWNNGGVVNIV